MNIVKQLRADLARLEEEIAWLTGKADSLRGTIAFYEEQGDVQESAQPAKALRNAVVEIMDAAGEPLHYTDIFARLQDRGISVGGKNPAGNVIAHMSGDDRFQNTGRGVWGLARWGEAKSPLAQADRLRKSLRSVPAWSRQGESDSRTDELSDVDTPNSQGPIGGMVMRAADSGSETFRAGAGSRGGYY